jgi:hypothetical protein
MTRHWIAASALGLGLFAAVGAQAQTALGNGSNTTVTDGAWQVVISGCSLTLLGGTASNNCSSEGVLATIAGNGSLSLEFENMTSGQPIFSETSAQSSSQFDDLAFGETVTHTGTPLVNAVTITATGYSPTGAFSDVSASQTITSPGPYSANKPAIAAGTGSSGSPVSNSIAQAITATNSISLSKDFHVTELSSGNAGLTKVTQVFNVPEPASLSLLAIGFAGLIGIRRKRARA